jgi:hypothetical protein
MVNGQWLTCEDTTNYRARKISSDFLIEKFVWVWLKPSGGGGEARSPLAKANGNEINWNLFFTEG